MLVNFASAKPAHAWRVGHAEAQRLASMTSPEVNSSHAGRIWSAEVA